MSKELSTYSLPQLAKRANEAASASETYAANAVAKAVEAGAALAAAKEKVKHGEWSLWVQDHWHGTARWATSLMKLADAPKGIDVENAGSIKEALRLIDDKANPEAKSNRNRGSDLDSTHKGDGSKAQSGAHLEEPQKPADPIQGEIVEDEPETASAPPQPSMASIVQDANGNDVPADLRDKFGLAAQLNSIGRELDAIKRKAVGLAKEDGGEFVPVQAIDLHTKALKDEITGAGYWSHCPRCGGDGCDRCDHAGFLPKSKRGHLSKADREALGI